MDLSHLLEIKMTGLRKGGDRDLEEAGRIEYDSIFI